MCVVVVSTLTIELFYFTSKAAYRLCVDAYSPPIPPTSSHLKAVVLPEDAAVNGLDDNLVLHT